MDHILSTTKALADGSRLRVIMALTDNEELCVCQITEMLKLAAPAVSRHISVLQKAGLVKSRKDSRWVYYRLSESFPPTILKWLKDMLAGLDDIVKDRKKIGNILREGAGSLYDNQKKKKERTR